MDDRRTGAAPRGQEATPEPRARVFLLAGDAPLPEGVAHDDDDEGVSVIRLVATVPAGGEAAQNVAY